MPVGAETTTKGLMIASRASAKGCGSGRQERSRRRLLANPWYAPRHFARLALQDAANGHADHLAVLPTLIAKSNNASHPGKRFVSPVNAPICANARQFNFS